MTTATPALADTLAMPIDTFAGALRAQRRATSLRCAALMLHALAPADRDWLLGQLPPARRAPLGELLDDLVQLGIPTSAALMQDGDPALAESAVDAAPESSPAQRLASCTPRALVAVLEREPASLTARLFELGDWPWKDAVLAGLSPGRRRQVQSAMADAAAPRRRAAALDAQLLCLLDERLAAAPARAGERADRQPLAWLARLRTGTRAGLSALTTKVPR